MTKTIVTLVALAALMLGGCRTSTEFGKCIGVTDKENPALNYDISGRNVVLACLFSEMIVVPAVVVLVDLKCPTGPAFGSK